MSTVAEIEEVLPKLSLVDLMRVEAALHAVQRQRGGTMIYDDAYGAWTEDDQASVAAEAWDCLEGEKPAQS